MLNIVANILLLVIIIITVNIISFLANLISLKRRLNYHWTYTIKGDQIYLHHEPMTFFYFLTKKGFTKSLEDAINKLRVSKKNYILCYETITTQHIVYKLGFKVYNSSRGKALIIFSGVILTLGNLYSYTRPIKLIKRLFRMLTAKHIYNAQKNIT